MSSPRTVHLQLSGIRHIISTAAAHVIAVGVLAARRPSSTALSPTATDQRGSLASPQPCTRAGKPRKDLERLKRMEAEAERDWAAKIP
jgi:hypothetical protein